ncbi:MAG: peptide chain release factor N(5)-glutamine methyltransferase [Pseudomonadota bacterium]|nr:peptide chain release factor N(5)-glutamine methyltransferase [Pseudomonadota bacterium]
MNSNYKTLRLWGYKFLKKFTSSPMLDSEIILSIVLGCDRSDILAFPEKPVSNINSQKFKDLISLRKNGMPIHYMLGNKEFYSIKFIVSSDTLIPRPETEVLVDTVLSLFSEQEKINILELGTGCGAIALTLKKLRPSYTITATDKNKKTLNIAKKNADILGLNINFVMSDWFNKIKYQDYDVIISNPPYVEAREMESNRNLAYEPKIALYGGKDGLSEIKLIIKESFFYLKGGGCLIIEHGSSQASQVKQITIENNFIFCKTLKDLAKLDRGLLAKKPI